MTYNYTGDYLYYDIRYIIDSCDERNDVKIE